MSIASNNWFCSVSSSIFDKIIVIKINAMSLFNFLSGIFACLNSLENDFVSYSEYFLDMYFGTKAMCSASFSLNSILCSTLFITVS